MKKLKQFQKIPMKICSLCNKSTETEGASLVYFGEWMSKKDITVHYYCLLLSTHLPQRGEDHSGILGFLLRDIRIEIAKAKNRKCKYCSEIGATIKCFTCEEYFHLTCGHTSKCLSQFVGDFRSFCHDCIPIDLYKMELFSRKPPQITELCFICAQIMGPNPKGWIYAKCCGNGFTHSKCMKIYALSAGYYLTCIWCKDKQFREDIKYLGIFVPDREANWEKEKGAYGELYCRHKRCDMEVCNCPKGRDYSNASKWQLIICKLCGSFGAHNPSCIPGYQGSKEKLQEFKCDICSVTEQTVLCNTALDVRHESINTSLYVDKNKAGEPKREINSRHKEFNSSQETEMNVVSKYASASLNTSASDDIIENMPVQTEIFTLTQSPANDQQTSATCTQKEHFEETSDSDDSIITNLLVQKVLDIFEVNSPRDANKNKKPQNISQFNLSQEIFLNEQQATIEMTTNCKPIKEFEESESCLHDSDDSITMDWIIQNMLDIFETNKN